MIIDGWIQEACLKAIRCGHGLPLNRFLDQISERAKNRSSLLMTEVFYDHHTFRTDKRDIENLEGEMIWSLNEKEKKISFEKH